MREEWRLWATGKNASHFVVEIADDDPRKGLPSVLWVPLDGVLTRDLFQTKGPVNERAATESIATPLLLRFEDAMDAAATPRI